MVLEQAIKAQWLEKRPFYAFFMGLVYALIGIISARLVFPGSTAMMAVGFTSILLIPSLNRLLSDEENVEIREDKLSFKMLLADHKDIFEIYMYLFLGIFLTFALITVFIPTETAQDMFSNQLRVAGLSGHATFFTDSFVKILTNNLIIMLVCLLLSFFYGSGSIIFLIWNASVWGAVFGFVAREAAITQSGNPLYFFGLTILPVLPHMVTEALSYLSASITGGVISKAVIREDMFSPKFHHIITDALIMLAFGLVIVFLAAVLEVHVYPLLR